MAWGNGAPRGWPATVTSPTYTLNPAWLPAWKWVPDPANSQNAIVNKNYGAGPNNTYSIYRTINFPMVAQDAAQYWYYTIAVPRIWTSTILRFCVHFIVEDTISLPGVYRFGLGARRQQDVSAVSGAKTLQAIDYTLADTNIPRYRITNWSGALNVAGATYDEALLLELQRGVPTNDESDSAYVVGVNLRWE